MDEEATIIIFLTREERRAQLCSQDAGITKDSSNEIDGLLKREKKRERKREGRREMGASYPLKDLMAALKMRVRLVLSHSSHGA